MNESLSCSSKLNVLPSRHHSTKCTMAIGIIRHTQASRHNQQSCQVSFTSHNQLKWRWQFSRRADRNFKNDHCYQRPRRHQEVGLSRIQHSRFLARGYRLRRLKRSLYRGERWDCISYWSWTGVEGCVGCTWIWWNWCEAWMTFSCHVTSGVSEVLALLFLYLLWLWFWLYDIRSWYWSRSPFLLYRFQEL